MAATVGAAHEFLIWHRDRDSDRSSRIVLRAREVPLLADAEALRDRIEQLSDEESRRISAATSRRARKATRPVARKGDNRLVMSSPRRLIALTQAAAHRTRAHAR